MGRHPLRRAAPDRPRGRCTGGRRSLLDRLGVELSPERPVRGLSIADQQIVEIAKALCFDARMLIMDEPTAALSGPEVERLFASFARCASTARRCCSSRTGWMRCSRSVTPSP